MQKITDSIREVDRNHIIFVERACAFKNMETGESRWKNLPFLIEDTNVVYEYHDYSPYSFTHQDTSWAGTKGSVVEYPSDMLIAEDYVSYWVDFKGADYQYTEGKWRYFESEKISRTEAYNIAAVVFQAADIGMGNTVYLDDVTIYEYDEEGNVKTNTYSMSREECEDFGFWSSDQCGKSTYSEEIGRTEQGCLAIMDTTSDANASGLKFELKEGKSYKITGWVYLDGVDEGKNVRPRLDFSLAESVYSLNREYLEAMFRTNMEFYVAHNVPVYVGEFGCVTRTFAGRGGENWVEDMLEILGENGISYSYHTYHEESFGLRMGSGALIESPVNEILVEVFRKVQVQP